ncbi:L-lactate permease [Weissella cibaria]|uniref:L-lactate permease n=1 Tax=Weissella cibaria TaxID=137591 RepID=UPI0021C13308|nr:L-lactate permease [Weissella cibaria]MCT8398128.1 L-lactate permease [Weissella cibaria]
MLFIALLAVILPLILLAVFNMPALKGMAISALVVTLAGWFIWQMPNNVMFASILQGIHKTFPILWILFGALMMLHVLRHTGAITRINAGFESLTADMRILAVLIAYLFGGLIEGVSGFGTPAMVTAPLLIALGFTPIAGVTLALVADSTSAAYGAVGTPLTVGLSNVAPANVADFMNNIAGTMTTIDLFGGTFMPLMLVMLLVTFFNRGKKSIKSWLEITPWALLIGLVYNVFAWLYAHTIGYEFVSILTPLTVLIIAVLTLKYRILLPTTVFTNPWKGANFTGDVVQNDEETMQHASSHMSLLTAWSPYLIVVVLLLLSRTIGWLKHFMTNAIDFGWVNILGIKGISSDWPVLYSPGFILTLAAAIALLVQARTLKPFVPAAKSVLASMVGTGVTLMVTLIMVQVFSNSGTNGMSLPSMPTYIAKTVSQHMAGVWVFVAPFLGELGAFITGSATVSTLTFSPIQADVAANAHLAKPIILALQVIGAAAGNMICVHNIVAASAVVGLAGQEGAILRKTAIPALVYGLLVGIAGAIMLMF